MYSWHKEDIRRRWGSITLVLQERENIEPLFCKGYSDDINLTQFSLYLQMQNELQNVISGKSQIRHGATIQAIAGYLKNGAPTSGEITQIKKLSKLLLCSWNSFLEEQTGNLEFRIQ